MNLIDAKFLQSAQSLEDSPAPQVAEVAFLGRSNVGKSSILNSLTKQKGLAKSSSTPGKTQLINYFDIKFKTEDLENPYVYARFVDLPGFGYAKVSKSLKAAWNKNLTGYLEKRPNLQIFVHLIDSRHPTLEIDKEVDDFVKHIKRGDQIIINAFTKIDKLNSSELGKLKRDYPLGIFVSNLKKKGIIDLQNKITEHLFGN
ncbi:ribosome biogenesis GTP-binding protein YihA/YsxC [Aliarcobacter thereius]|uniref:Probable GTP-binding protein EngB n=2 Tax=Aliarcobacter thereius TaxID=544718 RepID=A0A1C0B680_9BACT|nr:ribosome biogenesis GTP-binding protein YihA/YsxC [Aliarcobacter thereius]OCL90036.1 putative GTP-binding protein EngB [Aliarcobacter thereius]OCL96364.1 putative GTP-binding protein EngB [Aliarcobacter thereius LMG 24486]OCL98675.1 putative GTP-binding protein EngB [Aliarcobacter thereius]QBF15674.1 ribosome biogenesis GTP-binding protein YsxC/EngB [Aliarcobacter thereius LMG 24486]TLS71468.1 YihA family ribosome biogenesis GTP-binding protein [Aliarcobacter thereius]